LGLSEEGSELVGNKRIVTNLSPEKGYVEHFQTWEPEGEVYVLGRETRKVGGKLCICRHAVRDKNNKAVNERSGNGRNA
jgi:hypothetical protein